MHRMSRRPIGFPEYLDRLIEDARLRYRTLQKLDALYDLNSRSVLLSDEQAKNPIFDRLTLTAPRIDRNDPLGFLSGLAEPDDDAE